MLPIPLAGFVDTDDVWVQETGGRFRFAPEPQHLLFAGELPRQVILRATIRFKPACRTR